MENRINTMIRIETDGFEKISNNLMTEEYVKEASKSGIHYVFGDDSIGRFIYFIHSKDCRGVRFYFADDILEIFDNRYYDTINHKKGRVEYLKELGIKDIAIASMKRTVLKSISRYLYCQDRGIAVIGPRKCIFVHEVAVRELLENHSNKGEE